MHISGIDEGKGLSSFYSEFESVEYLRKEFMSYIPNKIESDQRGVALDVDETEYVLDTTNSDAYDNEGNREKHNESRELSIIEVKELVAAM